MRIREREAGPEVSPGRVCEPERDEQWLFVGCTGCQSRLGMHWIARRGLAGGS